MSLPFRVILKQLQNNLIILIFNGFLVVFHQFIHLLVDFVLISGCFENFLVFFVYNLQGELDWWFVLLDWQSTEQSSVLSLKKGGLLLYIMTVRASALDGFISMLEDPIQTILYLI